MNISCIIQIEPQCNQLVCSDQYYDLNFRVSELFANLSCVTHSTLNLPDYEAMRDLFKSINPNENLVSPAIRSFSKVPFPSDFIDNAFTLGPIIRGVDTFLNINHRYISIINNVPGGFHALLVSSPPYIECLYYPMDADQPLQTMSLATFKVKYPQYFANIDMFIKEKGDSNEN